MAETGWVKSMRKSRRHLSVQEELAIKRHVAEEARKISDILSARSIYKSARVR